MVEEVLALLLGVVADGLLGVDEAGRRIQAVVPAAGLVAGDGERSLGQGLAVVVQRGQVEVGHRAHALAPRTHAPGDREGPAHGRRVRALDRDGPATMSRGDVEGERLGRADVRPPEPAEEDAQHGVGVRRRAHRRAGVGPHALLVDDDRGGQPVEDVHLGPRQRRHEALHEGAVGLVDEPLRLRSDRAEDQRALARARDAGEHGQPAFRDLDAHVLEVVDARAVHSDQAVAVGDLERGHGGGVSGRWDASLPPTTPPAAAGRPRPAWPGRRRGTASGRRRSCHSSTDAPRRSATAAR